MSSQKVAGGTAPYLTHEVSSHHGQVTLSPLDNGGRLRQARQSAREARSRPRPERGNRADDEPRFNVGPRSLRAFTLNRGGRPSRRTDRNTIEPFYEAAYPDYPPPTFQEAMAETSTISSNVMNDAHASVPTPETPPSSSTVQGSQDQELVEASFCSSNVSGTLAPRESDAESDSSLEIVESFSEQTHDLEEQTPNSSDRRQINFPSCGRADDRGRSGSRKANGDPDSDDDEPTLSPQPQSPTKRRNLSLSPLRTLFPYRNAEPHRVHSAIPTANNSPYSHHTPFMSATSLPMKMSMSTTSFANSLKAESFLSRKFLSFKGKERAIISSDESLGDNWEVVERETPSLSSAVREMESRPISPPASPITQNFTPPATPPKKPATQGSHSKSASVDSTPLQPNSNPGVQEPRPTTPQISRNPNEPHPLSLRDRKVPLVPPKPPKGKHRQRNNARATPPVDPNAPLGPVVTTVRTRLNITTSADYRPQLQTASSSPPVSGPTQAGGVHLLPPPPPAPPAPPALSPPPYVHGRARSKTPPRASRSPLHQSISVPEPPMTPLFLTPPTTPVKATPESRTSRPPSTEPTLINDISLSHLIPTSNPISTNSTPYQTPRYGMSPNHSTADLLDLSPGSSRRHYTGRPLPRPPGPPQRIVDSVYAGAEGDDEHPIPNCCPEGLLINLDDDIPSSSSVTPTASMLISSANSKVQPTQPIIAVSLAAASSQSSLEEIPGSPIEEPTTPPRSPPRAAKNGPFLEVTDLDMLVNRLNEQLGDNNGSDYESLLTLTDFIGPATPNTVSEARQANSDGDGTLTPNNVKEQAHNNVVLTSRIEVTRRRVLQDGRIKIKLTLLDTSVDRCGVCLSRFREGDLASLGSLCKHAFHDQCISPWLARNKTCPMCRVALH